MEEEMIEVVVKECDSKRDDFPKKDSDEGQAMIQTIRKETIFDKDSKKET